MSDNFTERIPSEINLFFYFLLMSKILFVAPETAVIVLLSKAPDLTKTVILPLGAQGLQIYRCLDQFVCVIVCDFGVSKD